MENQGLFAFLLLALGLGILVAEIFIPSAGLLTVMAILCLCGSAWFAWNAWYLTGKYGIWWSYVAGAVVMLPVTVTSVLYILPRTEMGRTLFAAPQSLEEVTPFLAEEARLSQLIHRQGKTLTMFSPGGMAQIGSERFHAESEGVLIDAGTPVVVVGVNGNRLVVQPLEDHPSGDEPQADDPQDVASSSPADPATGTSSIDFDIPEPA